MGVIFIAFACTKDQALETNESSAFNDSRTLKFADPVIARYSDLGSIEKMPPSYLGQSSNLCSNHIAIYQLTPSEGPLKGLICEIYRFRESTDISGPCDDTYDLAQKEEQIGNIKYIHCPEEGSNCKTLDMPWGCTLVFCDDKDVDS